MPANERRVILANGEQYVGGIERPGRPGRSTFPRTYEEARIRVKEQVTGSLTTLASLPPKKKLGEEIVLALRLHPDATAKTYNPEALFYTVPDLENVGSRNYQVGTREIAATARITKQIEKGVTQTTGRLVFVRSHLAGFRRLLRTLDTAESELTEKFCEDIRRIERFDVLTGSEQLQAFKADKAWNGGRAELVMHPSQYEAAAQLDFLRQLFRGSLGSLDLRFVPYADGPTFASCHLTRDTLELLEGANPLRTAHPLTLGSFDDLRSAPAAPAPPPPTSSTRSTIKVGMFDGGVDPRHRYLQGHVEQDDTLSIKTTVQPRGIAHGTAVAGALLYGPLNDYDLHRPLPAPPVSVVSIRVFPMRNLADPDLYDAVDVIEAAVPARTDVSFWNISFGPRGPIFDDTISRFTYVLDTLAVTHKVGFCVAVGNDGEKGSGWSRIQAPSDLVNGLGVGAFTERKGNKQHAPYSCQGPGRECGKMKPDLVAFGGCTHTPIHLLSLVPGQKSLSHGTSFASPQAAAMGGQATGVVERGTSLLSRTLLVHTAAHPQTDPDYLLGHGLMRTSLEDLVRCDAREVTVVFQGDILATKSVRLPIMLPLGVVNTGTVQVTWTIAALPPVSPNHPSDYTTMCIEDTFYPDSQMFRYTNPSEKGKPSFKHLHIKRDALEIAELGRQGWKPSHFPISESGNRYATEHEKRALDYKWEPVVRRVARKRAASFHEPFLVLHAIPRHKASGRISYAAAVTITASKFNGDLYDAVLRRYSALQPIRLRTEAEIRISI